MVKKLLLVLTLITTCSFAQVQLASDINQGTFGSSIGNVVPFKNQLLFSAQIGVPFSASQEERLWKTDGTILGTSQINNLPNKDYFVDNNYMYYLEYNTQTSLYDVLKTDPTTSSNSSVFIQGIYNPEAIGVFNGYFYYVGYADLGVNQDKALFKSNGVSTELLITFPQTEYVQVRSGMYKFNDTHVAFHLYTVTNLEEPYITDGTVAGTSMLKELNPTNNVIANPNIFANIGSNTTFVYNKKQLWFSDGTDANTIKLKEFTGSSSLSIKGLTAFNNKFYFAFTHELWETDGTIAGTKLVFSNANGDGGIQAIINRGSDLLLLLERGVHLFTGATSSTTKLSTPDITYIREYHAAATSRTFFVGNYKNEGYRIWVTNGTSVGTYSLSPVWPDSATPTSIMYTLGNDLLFSSGSHLGEYHIGELWYSDGTNEGTKLIKDINQTGNIGSNPSFQTVLNGKLIFAADDNIHGRELFSFDGTTTTLIKDINPGFQSSTPHDFYVLNNEIVFKAYTLNNGLELWKTDGTESGTILIKDINPNQGDAFLNDNRAYVRLQQFKLFNNELYFYANNGTNGMEIWKTNGTSAGTIMLKDINPGANSSYRPSLDTRPRFVEFNNELYFIAASSGTDNNLGTIKMWKTNGTTSGTVIANVVNNAVNPATISVTKYFTFNNQLYFHGTSVVGNKTVLARTDGTNTVLINNIGNFKSHTVLDNKIYYLHNDFAGAGEELWVLDTNDTMALAYDIVPGSQGNNATNFYVHDGYLYFAIRNASYQVELWRLSNTTTPEAIITKSMDNLTYGLEDTFQYLSVGNKLYVFNKQTEPTHSFKMYLFDDNTAPYQSLFTLNSSNNFANSDTTFPLMSSFYNNKLYFTYSQETNPVSLELYVYDANALDIDDKINGNKGISNLVLYPNPATDKVYIKLSSNSIDSITIYNLLGKEIGRYKESVVDVSKYKSGYYMLVLIDKQGNKYSKKWIKN